ncbi:hypothetical protein NEUTE1DRAFT_103495 [Neurospora tetrasperma FGSC 2508]|uniref:Uncharacterized protein n=1 Tax=Neurospora tetrasperma (strain FGSC 2508 / ATCC MYA-4615 / P0657) TaxID=510951 RepID=F8MVU4_NEUT8|nr:uncharacterized protein NEUTE1DRAFT_103495 [Neurospora tetrasperma FGSC 2508]EGO53992.1 hypothetical protein NEUTE1DRAFT_103495 [Neurospora tetrasperma FGSC 2508]EGZ68587.1 hypothetical protein NEUTE2DRAFT_73682 [Neurospora tetrasperma FGSC 2509]
MDEEMRADVVSGEQEGVVHECRRPPPYTFISAYSELHAFFTMVSEEQLYRRSSF